MVLFLSYNKSNHDFEIVKRSFKIILCFSEDFSLKRILDRPT